ncbi:MAG: CBS domain-containing protein [Chloroflexota bacterium]|nr:MAG: hypothetical protein DLM70_07215 [Chloroflexota bacterium]
MKVRDLMRTPVITVPPTARVAEVAKLMVENHASGLPVIDEDGALVGLVTQEDVVAKHAKVHVPTYLGILGYALPFTSQDSDDDIRRILAVTAADLMTDRFVTIAPDRDVDEAATAMVDKHANPLPVVENETLVGIISRTDILRLVLAEEEDGDQDARNV